MKKRALAFILAGMLAVSSLTGCSSSFDGSAVAIKVGEDEVSADVANFYARYTQAQYETYYGSYLGDDMWSSQASEGQNYEEYVKAGLQETLEIMVLSEQRMSEYGVELTDAEKEVIAEAVKNFSEANTLPNLEYVSGQTEVVERVMTLMAIQKKVQDAIAAGAEIEVTDEEAAQKSMDYVRLAYTTTNDDGEVVELSTDEKAELKAKAEAFAEEAKTAEDFKALAETHGLTVQTITFDAESTMLETEAIAAADELELGEVSDVIDSSGACYVMLVTSLFDEAATATKKEELILEGKQEFYLELTAKWIEEADITVNEDVWDTIDFNDLTISMVSDESDPYADEIQTDDVAE